MSALASVGPSRSPDLRLAFAAGAAWPVAAVAAERTFAFDLAVGTGALLIALAAWRLPRARVAAPASWAALGVLLVLVPLTGRTVHAAAAPLTALGRAGASVTLWVTVSGDPHLLAPSGTAGAPRVVVDATATSVSTDGGPRVPTDGAVSVIGPARGWAGVLPGQAVRLAGRLQRSLAGGPAAMVLYVQIPPQILGRPPWYQRLAGHVRDALRRACSGLPPDVRGLLPGLIDGDTSAVDPVVTAEFRSAGLTHLLAVSGANCSILLGVTLLFLRRVRARPVTSAVMGGLVLAAFVLVARPSPSVVRAAAMATVALAALALGRPRQALPALSGSVLALLVWRPALAIDGGFAMSVLATAALLFLAPRWARWLRGHRVPAGLAEALAVAGAAHLATAPIAAALYGQVSLVAVPANLLAEPAVAVTTVVGFAAAVIAPIWRPPAAALAQVAGWPCRWLLVVAGHLGSAPGASIAWPRGMLGGLELLALLLTVGLAATRSTWGRALAVVVVVATLIQIPVRAVLGGWPPAGWTMLACDVGQGDALALAAGPHAAIVIDTGSDPVPEDRCLRDVGIGRIPLLVLTHFHMDHVGGIAGALRGRPVGAVMVSPLAEPAEGVRLVTEALRPRGVTPAVGAPGMSFDIGPVHLDVLGPYEAASGTRSDPNNSSIVLRATIGGQRLLLPGDAEIEEQQDLLDHRVDLRAEVLKAPHHGSAYSSPDFLTETGARVTVISAGRNNDYGLPAPSMLNELERLGQVVRRTDRDGDVAVVGAGTALRTYSRAAPNSSLGPVVRAGGRLGRDRGPEPLPPTAAVPSSPGRSAHPRVRPRSGFPTARQNASRLITPRSGGADVCPGAARGPPLRVHASRVGPGCQDGAHGRSPRPHR